jgi:hypothetical protein
MAEAALAAFARFECLIEPFADRTSLRNRAAQRLLGSSAMPSALIELGALVVVLPVRLDPADVRLLAASSHWVPVHAAFATFADDELANALPAAAAADLCRATSSMPSAQAKRAAEPPIFIIRAPDPSEEIREVVRTIARELESQQPVPLHRMAVLYRQADPYATLVRDALTLAGPGGSDAGGQRARSRFACPPGNTPA